MPCVGGSGQVGCLGGGMCSDVEEGCALTWRQGTSQEVPCCPDEGVESFRCIFKVEPTGLQD